MTLPSGEESLGVRVGEGVAQGSAHRFAGKSQGLACEHQGVLWTQGSMRVVVTQTPF